MLNYWVCGLLTNLGHVGLQHAWVFKQYIYIFVQIVADGILLKKCISNVGGALINS